MSTFIVIMALLFVVGVIYAISVQNPENTSNEREEFNSSSADIENDEDNPLIVTDFRLIDFSEYNLFEHLEEFYVLKINTSEYSSYTTERDLVKLSDNTIVGSIRTYDRDNRLYYLTAIADNFKDVYNNMVEINILDMLNDKVSNLNHLHYKGHGDTLCLELDKDCLYLQVFLYNGAISYIDGYYNLMDLNEELSLVKVYKALCSVSSILVCEDPRKTHWKVFLEHEYNLKKIEDSKLKNWVDSVVKKHQEYNDLQYKYETIPAAPIDDIDGFLNFCKIVHEDVSFEEYKIQNYLTQLVNERKLQMESGK